MRGSTGEGEQEDRPGVVNPPSVFCLLSSVDVMEGGFSVEVLEPHP